MQRNLYRLHSFLKLLTIIDKDATTIKQTVKNYLTQMKFNLKLLTGFGSDGASVMTGPNAGVAVQLRLDEDFLSALIAAHCSGHKVPLTCLDAMNPRTGADIAAHFDSYKTFIIALRSIFKNSSQRCAELEKCQQELNIPKRRVLKYIPTRWMSLYSVSSRLVGNYKALWNCLTNLIKENKISDKKSKQNIALILANLQTFNVLSTCQFLTIVLKPLFIFCERMQSNSLTINDLFMDVNDVISQLQNFIAGGCRVGIIYEAKNGINESTQTYAFKHQESLEFKGEVEDIIKLENLFIQFSKNLLRAFEHRFPFPVLYQALALFDFNIWNKNCIIYPSDDQKRIEEKNMLKHNFGNNFISILAKHFHRNEVDVNKQWSDIRRAIYTNYSYVESREEVSAAWNSLYVQYGEKNQDIFYFVAVALTLPLSSASCDRGFSKQNIIKTRHRSRMLQPMLDSLIRISTHAKTFKEIDYNHAKTQWELRNDINAENEAEELLKIADENLEADNDNSSDDDEGELFVTSQISMPKRKKIKHKNSQIRTQLQQPLTTVVTDQFSPDVDLITENIRDDEADVEMTETAPADVSGRGRIRFKRVRVD